MERDEAEDGTATPRAPTPLDALDGDPFITIGGVEIEWLESVEVNWLGAKD